MLFSLVGLIQSAEDENEANMNIHQINDIVCETKMHDIGLLLEFLKQMKLKIFAMLYKKT